MWGRLLYATALLLAGVLIAAVTISVIITLTIYAKEVAA